MKKETNILLIIGIKIFKIFMIEISIGRKKISISNIDKKKRREEDLKTKKYIPSIRNEMKVTVEKVFKMIFTLFTDELT